MTTHHLEPTPSNRQTLALLITMAVFAVGAAVAVAIPKLK